MTKAYIMKYGYVLEMHKGCRNYPGFYQKEMGRYVGPLRTANVLGRNMAYALRYDNETVRKVELFKNGKPKRLVKLRRRRCEAVTKNGKRCKRSWKANGHRCLCIQHTKMWDNHQIFTRRQSKRYV